MIDVRFVKAWSAAVLACLVTAGAILGAAPVAADAQDFTADLTEAGIPESAHTRLAFWGGMACQLAVKMGTTDVQAVNSAIKENADNVTLSREQATVVWQSAKANLCDADGNLVDEMK